MVATELILGMEELVNHIRELEAKNKKLQEYKDLEKDILVSDVNEKQDKISLLEAENKKLKDENKVSEDQINQQEEWFKEINILVGEDEDEPAVNSVMDFVVEHKKLQEQLEAFESLTGIGRDVVCRHNDPVLYPNDTGTIQDPENPEDYYSFGDNCKSKIGDNFKMKRILRNGSIKDCVKANAFCIFSEGGKLYYIGRGSKGPRQVRTIKGEKTTMKIPEWINITSD